MAYNNNNNNNQNNKKKNNDYFSRNIKQKGENFIGIMTTLEIQRDAIRIFRDIAKGAVDLDAYSHYFEDTTFLDNCILAAEAKLKYHSINADANERSIFQDQQNGLCVDPMRITVAQNERNKATAYNIVRNSLLAVKFSNDTSNLYVMANQLRPYRNLL